MNDTWQRILAFYKNNSVVYKLIIINVLIFLIVNIIGIIFYLSSSHEQLLTSNPLLLWLAVPADFNLLMLKPWTVFTYMFFHLDFLHILFNMIMLYFGASVFLNALNSKQLISTYIAGGIVGGLFYIVAFNIFPVFQSILTQSIALGASASVLAILIAIASYRPETILHLLFIGNIKLKYIAIFFVLIDLISIDKGNPGGHIAHLGGAFWGLLYGIGLKRGINLTSFIEKSNKNRNYTFKNNKKSKIKVEYKTSRPLNDDQYNKKKVENQKRVDEILDKISQSGYDSLSKEEKDFLFKSSK